MSNPAMTNYTNGISQVSSDNLNTFMQTCTNMAQLRGFAGNNTAISVYVRGTTTADDGGQGTFYWNATVVGTDDNGATTVVPNGVAIGCWTRLAIGTGPTTLVASSLKSATTIIDVASAPAPSSGEVLTATSPTTATWQSPGGGALTKLSTKIASNSASIDFDDTLITATYQTYVIDYNFVVGTVNNDDFSCRIFQANAPVTSSFYTAQEIKAASSSLSTLLRAAASKFFVDGNVGLGNSATQLAYGTITINNPSDTTSLKLIESNCTFVDASGNLTNVHLFGRFTSNTTAIDGITLYFDSGNVASGQFILYGIS